MFKKSCLIICLVVLLSFLIYSELLAQQRPGPPPPPGTEIRLGTFPVDTSADGLKLVKGFVTGIYPIKAGRTIKVYFVLQNVSGRTITFDSNGVFVGARWNSTTDANNRDFGHQYRNYTLPNNGTVSINAQIVVDRPGVWRFWPAYHINGRYGPFRWHEIVVNVE